MQNNIAYKNYTMKLKISTIQIIVMIACCMLPCLLHAQPGFGDDVDDVPIDGGLSLLIAAGVGYTAKKMRTNKNK